MEVREERREGAVIQFVSGRIDAITAVDLEQKLMAAIQDPAPMLLVIDCSEVKYISSAGLRVLLLGAKRAALFKGQLRLCAVTNFIRQIFDLAGLPSIIPIYPTLEAALALVNG